jgi:hypothetical protein
MVSIQAIFASLLDHSHPTLYRTVGALPVLQDHTLSGIYRSLGDKQWHLAHIFYGQF